MTDATDAELILSETARLGRVIQLMAEELTHISGSCPADCRGANWDDCETVCAQKELSQDEIITNCWIRYFTEKEIKND